MSPFCERAQDCLGERGHDYDCQTMTELHLLRARVDTLESTLRQIQRWDMLNPPYPGVLSDAPWLKKLVDDALAPPATSGGEGK